MLEPSPNSGAAATDPGEVTAQTLDLSNCDREPIHLVTTIQPHGALLVLAEPTLLAIQASANAAGFLDLPDAPVIGQTLDQLLGEADARTLRTRLDAADPTDALAHLLYLPDRRLHLFGHRNDGLVLLELERGSDASERMRSEILFGLPDMVGQLQRTPSLNSLLAVLVERIRTLSGFERVMAYRFDQDGSGEVVAEVRAPQLDAYLGLHYPASDIPAPARRMFALSALRHLPDVDYVPVPLLPQSLPATGGQPVDLSYSFLRSVSVMYSDYLRNMGAKATLVMPLLKDGALWGLISCMQHSTPRYLTYEQRVPIELLTQVASQLMGHREDLDHAAYRARLDRVLHQLADAMAASEPYHAALVAGDTNLLAAIDADGAALIIDGKATLLGNTPSAGQVRLIADWLAQQDEVVFSTHHLAQAFPPAAAFSAEASGVLSIRLARADADLAIWFRPEALAQIHWAGDPNKPVEIDTQDREIRLRPRTSFAVWKETVRGQSRPWLDCERDYAKRLRQAIFDAMAERTRVLERMNAELERSNLDLDAFAYAASHDLREPLRGIHNFADLLKMEDAAHLSDRGRQRLATILRLTGRMDYLLESLLRYARVLRNAPELEACPIGALVAETAEIIQAIFSGEQIAIGIQPDLPAVACDRARVSVVFQNLIVNAIKYNDQAEKRIDIGCLADRTPPVFFVRDNGIGIAPAQRALIFALFRRLHGRDDYGGGAGVGLTIAQKVVKRHGGRIWVESVPGQGSTFYFTLAADPATVDLDQ
ncbi:ATP-binding protein [uncultured Thiodictyon sp.]|uniref:ATP-binding protein n=1 Tax=uncultured Thiodictyon sp. TaxID=1846217 RepID=UPI0025D8162A|nr:ATP-binding protein [uncultured Thiodictyon sp.]